MKGNTVNMGSVSASIWDTEGVTTFHALQMPFLITNYAIEKKVLDSTSPKFSRRCSPTSKSDPEAGPARARDSRGRAPQAGLHRGLHHDAAGL